jgi:hypothetical protein
MKATAYLWTGFSIPEWGDNVFLPVEKIHEIQELLQPLRIDPRWFRRPGADWIVWEFQGGLDDTHRRHLQTLIMAILLRGLPKGKRDPLVRWVGTRTTTETVHTMNEHIQ